MHPFTQNDPEWLSENEAIVMEGQLLACPDGVQRKVLLVHAARSAAPYVYREGQGPCFLTRDAIDALRRAVLAAVTAAAVATAAEATTANL